MTRRVLARWGAILWTLAVSMGSAVLSSGAQAQEQVARYTVTVSLSAAAAGKLSSSGEMVHVAAMYFGQARPGVMGDEMGEIHFTKQDADIRAPGVATLGGITLAADKLRKIKGRPELLINVYSSRKVFKDNLLDCNIFQDDPRKAAAGIAITCKLIGEK